MKKITQGEIVQRLARIGSSLPKWPFASPFRDYIKFVGQNIEHILDLEVDVVNGSMFVMTNGERVKPMDLLNWRPTVSADTNMVDMFGDPVPNAFIKNYKIDIPLPSFNSINKADHGPVAGTIAQKIDFYVQKYGYSAEAIELFTLIAEAQCIMPSNHYVPDDSDVKESYYWFVMDDYYGVTTYSAYKRSKYHVRYPKCPTADTYKVLSNEPAPKCVLSRRPMNGDTPSEFGFTYDLYANGVIIRCKGPNYSVCCEFTAHIPKRVFNEGINLCDGLKAKICIGKDGIVLSR